MEIHLLNTIYNQIHKQIHVISGISFFILFVGEISGLVEQLTIFYVSITHFMSHL